MLDYSGSLDRVFYALSDPTRREIVAQLSQGDRAVSSLTPAIPMSLAAVLQHVQVLESSGLVRSQKVGRTRTCRLDDKVLNQAETWLAQHRAMWERRLDLFEEVLAQQKTTPKKSDKGKQEGNK